MHRKLLGSVDTVIVKKKKGNVRSGPGTEFEIEFTVAKGVPFRVLQRKGKWIHIEHAEGYKGWIFETLVW